MPHQSLLSRFALYALALIALVQTLHSQSIDASQTSIHAVLTAQVEAWNAGNIEGFMQGYVQSDSMRFASGATVQRGWKAALERYKKSYPTKAAMGRLTFSELEMTMLSPEAALVLGRWKLQREKDEPQGLFTLVFRRTASGWRIIHDHTSAK
jgi:ketosteroid isomerase-like protein